MNSKDSIYVAGPMSWVPQFNIPMFDRVAEHLRGDGFNVISPAELDSEEIRRIALASPDGDPEAIVSTIETYGEILGRDVTVIIDRVNALMLLPNWENSTGANIEVCTAIALGVSLYEWAGYRTAQQLSHDDAWDIMKEARHDRHNHKRFAG